MLLLRRMIKLPQLHLHLQTKKRRNSVGPNTLTMLHSAAKISDIELLEMILGAMGRDALGMGAGLAHPRESEEWRAMELPQKLEFFAPIWRVMRDENMTVDQVSGARA